MIQMPLKNKISPTTITKLNYSLKNKLNFRKKLQHNDWTYLYSLNETNKAFNYFIKKLKRINSNCFPYQSTCYKNKPTPWLTSGIL